MNCTYKARKNSFNGKPGHSPLVNVVSGNSVILAGYYKLLLLEVTMHSYHTKYAKKRKLQIGG